MDILSGLSPADVWWLQDGETRSYPCCLGTCQIQYWLIWWETLPCPLLCSDASSQPACHFGLRDLKMLGSTARQTQRSLVEENPIKAMALHLGSCFQTNTLWAGISFSFSWIWEEGFIRVSQWCWWRRWIMAAVLQNRDQYFHFRLFNSHIES